MTDDDKLFDVLFDIEIYWLKRIILGKETTLTVFDYFKWKYILKNMKKILKINYQLIKKSNY